MKESYKKFWEIVLNKIKLFFETGDESEHKQYVAQTLSGFGTIISTLLKMENAPNVIDENLRNIFKIYINNSVNILF